MYTTTHYKGFITLHKLLVFLHFLLMNMKLLVLHLFESQNRINYKKDKRIKLEIGFLTVGFDLSLAQLKRQPI